MAEQSRRGGDRSPRIFRALLAVYPSQFRDEYGREMAMVFADRYRDARSGWERAVIWLRAIGGLIVEAPKEHGGLARQDVRDALRTFRRHPGLVATVVLTLAIGIGANTAMFSVVNGVILNPLPYNDPDALVSLYTRFVPSSGYDFPYFSISGPELVDLRKQVSTLSISAYFGENWNAAPDGLDAERVQGVSATADLFAVLGVQAAMGRTFAPEDATPGAPCVTVLSDGFWRERLGGVGDVAGRQIRLDGRPCTVIGVMAPAFFFPVQQVRLWTPLALDPAAHPNWGRGNHYFQAVARVTEGHTLAQAEAELDSLRARWSEQYPDHYALGHFAVVRSLKDDLVGDLRPALVALLGAVGLVLIIVCGNLVGLLTARAEGRRREVAIRSALGGGRGRLVRQLLTEHLLLVAAGGALGLLVAWWMSPVLLALYSGELPRGGRFEIDGTLLLFTGLTSGVAGLAVGLTPAIHSTRAGVQDALRDGRAATVRRSSVRMQGALVVAQIALSVVVIIGATLLVRSYAGLRQIDAGFDPHGVLSFRLFTPIAGYPSASHVQRFYASLRERLAALPGVDSVGAISNLPMQSGGAPDDFSIEGAPPVAPGEPGRNARYLMVTPGTIEALRVPLRRGRLITEQDGAGQPPVALINESAARIYWPTVDPVGRRIRYGEEDRPWITIVGVVADIRSLGLDRPAPPAIYAPLAQSPRPQYQGRGMTVVLRTDTDLPGLVQPARHAVAALDPTLPLAEVLPMTTVVERSAGRSRFAALLMSLFGLSALVLGALGIYGLLGYVVERRRAEIGVRVALGATRAGVYRLVLMRGLVLAASGVVSGLAMAVALRRMMSGLLYGVSATDPMTFGGVALALLAVAIAACAIPARRAARIDALAALRGE